MPGGPYPPPQVIASWPPPNFVDPETRGSTLLITCVALSTIGIIAVAARLYARLFITKAPGIDDAIIVVALLLGIGVSALAIYGTQALYVGYHAWDIPLSGFTPLRMNSWLEEWFVAGALAAVKISVLLFYRRLSVTFSKSFLWATWIGITYNLVCFLATILSVSFVCRPTVAYWLTFDLTWLAAGHTYSCSNVEGVMLPLYSGLSVLGDFYSTTLPLCLVASLKMGRRQKLSLYCLFALGYLVVVAGIIRTVYVNITENETYDAAWSYYDCLIWVIVEFYVALLCASAPGLKPFVRKFLVDPISHHSNSSKDRPRSGYTFGGSGKKYIRHASETYLDSTANDEESGTLGEEAVELSEHSTDYKKQQIGIAVLETNDCFNDRPRHSLIHNETSTGLVPFSKPQYVHPGSRLGYTSEEPIQEAPQILDNRILVHPGQVVPFSLRIPSSPPRLRTPTPPSRLPTRLTTPSPTRMPPSPPRGAVGSGSPYRGKFREATSSSSFHAVSALPSPMSLTALTHATRAPSRISEDDELATLGPDGHPGYEFELPMQGTRENTPVDDLMRSVVVRPAEIHARSGSGSGSGSRAF